MRQYVCCMCMRVLVWHQKTENFASAIILILRRANATDNVRSGCVASQFAVIYRIELLIISIAELSRSPVRVPVRHWLTEKYCTWYTFNCNMYYSNYTELYKSSRSVSLFLLSAQLRTDISFHASINSIGSVSCQPDKVTHI